MKICSIAEVAERHHLTAKVSLRMKGELCSPCCTEPQGGDEYYGVFFENIPELKNGMIIEKFIKDCFFISLRINTSVQDHFIKRNKKGVGSGKKPVSLWLLHLNNQLRYEYHTICSNSPKN